VIKICNDIYFGPTAVPAFGREHYSMLLGLDVDDGLSVGFNLAMMYFKNNQNFRKYTHDESPRFFKSNFVEAAKKLVPNLKSEHLLKCNKVGIRAQLVNKKEHKLEMDFIVEKKENTVHILNAVSPAFTSSFAISQRIVDNYI
jgi:(S)-2-hydroxyglutarate dehydrogenase